MQITVENNDSGFSLGIGGQHFHAPPSKFQFPREIWETFPAKQALVNELAYVTLLTTPILLDHPRIHFSTSPPRYIQDYHDWFEQAIPNLVEWIPDESTPEILEKFRTTQRSFSQSDTADIPERGGDWNNKRVVLPLSFGKDSLLSLAALQHFGYEVIPVNMDEVIQPRWNAIRNVLIERLSSKFTLQTQRVTNELQMLSDYQVLGCPESRLYQMQVHFSYLLAMLPFCYHYHAPYVILSNEYVNNLNKVHREGYLLPHKVMQSWEGSAAINSVAQDFSGGEVSAISLIQGLGNFAIHRLLHDVFSSYGELRVSCHLEMCHHDRWCHNCERCAQAYVFTLAMKQNPNDMGFKHTMLDSDKAQHFRIFGPTPNDADEFRQFVCDEERLAFYMAYNNGAEGELVDRFCRDYLEDTDREVQALSKRVFTVYGESDSDLGKQAEALFRALLEKYHV